MRSGLLTMVIGSLGGLALCTAGAAWAFTGATSSQGEASPILVGEYNCTGGNATHLTLTNTDPLHGYCACVQIQSGLTPPGFLDEVEGLVDVSDFDTDTIDLCALHPDTAGRIEVVMFRNVGIDNNCGSTFRNNSVEGGLYGWETDVSATGMAKSELRPVPTGTESAILARNLCGANNFGIYGVPASAFLNGSYE